MSIFNNQELTVFDADENETLENCSDIWQSSRNGRNSRQLEDDFPTTVQVRPKEDLVRLKQKYEQISNYITKRENEETKPEEGANNTNTRDIIKAQKSNNVKILKNKKIPRLTLRVASSSSNFFPKGMEININHEGLDANYPFAMKPEYAQQCYNLRLKKDGVVYFGYDPFLYLPITLRG